MLPLFFAPNFTQNSIVCLPSFAELLSERNHRASYRRYRLLLLFFLSLSDMQFLAAAADHGQTLPNTLIPSHIAASVLLLYSDPVHISLHDEHESAVTMAQSNS